MLPLVTRDILFRMGAEDSTTESSESESGGIDGEEEEVSYPLWSVVTRCDQL